MGLGFFICKMGRSICLIRWLWGLPPQWAFLPPSFQIVFKTHREIGTLLPSQFGKRLRKVSDLPRIPPGGKGQSWGSIPGQSASLLRQAEGPPFHLLPLIHTGRVSSERFQASPFIRPLSHFIQEWKYSPTYVSLDSVEDLAEETSFPSRLNPFLNTVWLPSELIWHFN